MDYLLLIAAFVSGLVGIVGHTWNKDRVGWRRATMTGWLTSIILLLTLAGSAYNVYQQRAERLAAKVQKDKVEHFVHDEIKESIQLLLSPFRALYTDYSSSGYQPDNQITFDKLLDPKALEAAQSTCMEKAPSRNLVVLPTRSWNEIFHEDLAVGLSRLTNVTDHFATELNADMLNAVTDLRNKGAFSRLAAAHPSALSHRVDEPTCFIGQPIGAFKQYLTMLKRISDLNVSENLLR